MSYTIDRIQNPEAIHVKLDASFNPATDIVPYFTELYDTIDNESSPVTSIIDILDVSFSIPNLLETTRDMQQLEVNPAQHPMSKQMIIISTNKMMRMSMDGFRKFGIFKTVFIVATYDDAIALLERQNRDSA